MDIEKIKSLAGKVAEEHEQYTSALEAELDAEALALEKLIEAIKPALPALSVRPKIQRTIGHREEASYASWKGVRLGGDGVDEVRSGLSDTRGEYEGCSYYLVDIAKDRTFAGSMSIRKLTYTGTWSRWQGESSSWTAEEEELTLRQLVKELDVDDIARQLSEALVKQLDGNKLKRRKEAMDRAEQLRAVASLLAFR